MLEAFGANLTRGRTTYTGTGEGVLQLPAQNLQVVVWRAEEDDGIDAFMTNLAGKFGDSLDRIRDSLLAYLGWTFMASSPDAKQKPSPALLHSSVTLCQYPSVGYPSPERLGGGGANSKYAEFYLIYKYQQGCQLLSSCGCTLAVKKLSAAGQVSHPRE
nr:hypothetical protein [Dickeya dadantii]